MLGLGKESILLLLHFLVTSLFSILLGEYKGIQTHHVHHFCLGIIFCIRFY